MYTTLSETRTFEMDVMQKIYTWESFQTLRIIIFTYGSSC